jgi:hypothetical protein
MIFKDDIEVTLTLACEELQMTRDEIIRLTLREWLEQYGFIPLHQLDEGSDTECSACIPHGSPRRLEVGGMNRPLRLGSSRCLAMIASIACAQIAAADGARSKPAGAGRVVR